MRPDLVAKYQNQRVPRYTSYPPSPHFSEAVGADAYRSWLGDLSDRDTLSLYLHVPFCRSMCWYCGCHTTIVPHDEPIRAYLGDMGREIAAVAGAMIAAPAVTHVHFGGGTPTLIPPDAFVALMDDLRRRFRFGADAEIAVEVDPRTLTAEAAEALGRGGVNRASLGVQSLDEAVQRAINRIQSYDCTALAVSRLRAAGIARLNLDLIYGLPRQTVASAAETAARVLDLRPARLSVFGYAHMPGFKKHQERILEAELPGADERLAQAEAIDGVLSGAGYQRIGLDHYALPDDPMAVAARDGTLRRNFQGYTTDAASALLAFGASAIGRTPGGFAQNHVLLPAYRRAVAEHGFGIAKGFALSAEDRLRAELIELTMCRFEVDVAAVAARHGLPAAAVAPDAAMLAQLVRDGMAMVEDGVLRVPEDARPLVRSVAALFDAYLAPESGRHSRAI